MKIVDLRDRTVQVPTPRLTREEFAQARSKIGARDKGGFAKLMRENPTSTEQQMSDLLTKLRVQFKAQVPMFGYIADFYVSRSKSVIEVDGPIHKRKKTYDRHRDEVFQSHGIRVLRITEQWLETNPDAVADEVAKYLKNGRAMKNHAKRKADNKKQKGVTRWQDVPKLSKNHLPR